MMKTDHMSAAKNSMSFKVIEIVPIDESSYAIVPFPTCCDQYSRSRLFTHPTVWCESIAGTDPQRL